MSESRFDANDIALIVLATMMRRNSCMIVAAAASRLIPHPTRVTSVRSRNPEVAKGIGRSPCSLSPRSLSVP